MARSIGLQTKTAQGARQQQSNHSENHCQQEQRQEKDVLCLVMQHTMSYANCHSKLTASDEMELHVYSVVKFCIKLNWSTGSSSQQFYLISLKSRIKM
jgi:hypothetical protein